MGQSNAATKESKKDLGSRAVNTRPLTPPQAERQSTEEIVSDFRQQRRGLWRCGV